MARLSSLMNFEVTYDLNPKTSQSINVFCICCLHQNVPFINLLTCSHKDFLNTFTLPQLKPVNLVICHQCHDMLKKIQQFKQQVEDSLKLLAAQVNIPASINLRRNRLTKTYRVVDVYIPRTKFNNDYQQKNCQQQSKEKSNSPNCTKDKKITNNNGALNVIDSNKNNNDCVIFFTTSPQSIATTKLLSLNTSSDYELPVYTKMLSRAETLNTNKKLSGANYISNTVKNITRDSAKVLIKAPNNTNYTMINKTYDEDDTEIPMIVKIESEGITAVSNYTIMSNNITDDTVMLVEVPNDTAINKKCDEDQTEFTDTVKIESDDITHISSNTITSNNTTDDTDMLIAVPYDTTISKKLYKNDTEDDNEILIEVPCDTTINKNSGKDETELPVIVKIESDDNVDVSNNTIMSFNTTDGTQILIEDNDYASTYFEIKEKEMQLLAIGQTKSIESNSEINLLESAATIKETQTKTDDVAKKIVKTTLEELMPKTRSKTAGSTSYLKSPHRFKTRILGLKGQSKTDVAKNVVKTTLEELMMKTRSKTAGSTPYLKSPHHFETRIHVGFKGEDHFKRKDTCVKTTKKSVIGRRNREQDKKVIKTSGNQDE